jgi:hypothetical protein
MAGSIVVCNDFIKGDSFFIRVSHTPAVDLSTAVFRLVMKNKEDATTAVLDVSYDIAAAIIAESPATIIADNAALGIAYVLIPSSATGIQPGEYYASLTRTIGADVNTLVQTGLADARKVVVHKKL